jgi:hypothetical protein
MNAEVLQLAAGAGAPEDEPEAAPDADAEPEAADDGGPFWAALPAEPPHPDRPASAIKNPAAQIKMG